MSHSELEAFQVALHSEPERVEAALTRFDARTAHATVPADKELIMAVIAERFGDVLEFNAVVAALLRKALAAFSWHEGNYRG